MPTVPVPVSVIKSITVPSAPSGVAGPLTFSAHVEIENGAFTDIEEAVAFADSLALSIEALDADGEPSGTERVSSTSLEVHPLDEHGRNYVLSADISTTGESAGAVPVVVRCVQLLPGTFREATIAAETLSPACCVSSYTVTE